jgi:hypothetical protein
MDSVTVALRAVAIENWLSGAAILSALAVPIVALEACHRDSSAYPKTLRDLVPKYLSPAALTAPDDDARLKSHFEYRADSGRFELSLRYYGPGVNRCRVGPGTSWSCSGYF